MKNLVYILLKGAKGVREAKGGNELFVETIAYPEGSLLFVPLSNSEAIEYSDNV